MFRNNRLLALFVTLMLSVNILWIAFSGTPPAARAGGFSAPRVATPTISRNVNAKYVDNLQAAQTPAANKLLPLDASSKFPLAVIPQGAGSGLDADKVDGLESTALQKRVTGTCAAGNAVNSIGANGTVGCQATGGMTLPFNGAGSDAGALFQISNDKGDGVQGESSDYLGVSGYTKSGSGVYGDNGNSDTMGHAGYFNGRVHVTQGLVVDGNLSAANLPGVTFTQGGRFTYIQNRTMDIDSMIVAVPATGYLVLTGSVDVDAGNGGFNLYYSLLDRTHGTTLAVTAERERSGQPLDELSRTMHLTYVVPVTAGTYTFKTTLEEFGNWIGQAWNHHSLIAMYFPVEYAVSQ